MIEKTVADISKRSFLLGAAAALLLMAVGSTASIPGFIMGLALGLVNMAMLARDASAIAGDQPRSRNRIVRNFFIRYAAMAVILVAYCGMVKGSIVACFIGLAVVQLSTFWTGVST